MQQVSQVGIKVGTIYQHAGFVLPRVDMMPREHAAMPPILPPAPAKVLCPIQNFIQNEWILGGLVDPESSYCHRLLRSVG